MRALAWLARYGRHCLIAGLVAGLLLPGLAQAIRPWIGEFIAVLLVITGARVGARAALGSLGDLGSALVRIALLQVAAPLVAIALLAAFGLLAWPLALAVALLLSAPSVTGAPNFAAMVGQDPAPGMRLLVLGTALFPLTALPVLTVLDPAGAGPLGAVGLSLTLLVAVMGAVAAGFGLRALFPGLGAAPARPALDGIAALLLGIVVVGLMSAIGPLLRNDPGTLALWLLAACGVNFGLQALAYLVARPLLPAEAVATAIYAGNRNIALFLIVLPDALAAPLMVFIGCYQIPMYLTPTVLARLRASGWLRDGGG